MKREDDQELWDLLGKARQPVVSPFFARNVVREIRQESGWGQIVRGWLRPRRLIPATALAIALVMAAFSLNYHSPDNDSSSENVPDLLASIDPQDYEVVADLDDLLAAEEDNLWSDSSSL